jgi:hypothetical protein
VNELAHHLFRQVLRALIETDHVFQTNGRGFVTRHIAARSAQRGDGAGVDKALYTRLDGGFQNLARACDVAPEEIVPAVAPIGIKRSYVEDPFTASHPLAQGGPIT